MRLINTFALIALISLSSPVAGQSFSDGLDALRSGDYDTGAEIMEKFANQGNPSAQHNMSVLYYQGNGVPKNLSMSAGWARLAAEQGYASSQVLLGIKYEDGNGLIQNYSKARKWYRLAAEQGNPKGQAYLAGMYFLGIGVSRNPALAYTLSSLAAAQGDDYASDLRDKALKQLSTQQTAEAQRLASQWQSGDPLPEPRDFTAR